MNDKELYKLLRETIMRCNLMFPKTEQDLIWFEQGTDKDFMERLTTNIK